MKNKSLTIRKINFPVLLIAIILSCFGLLMIYDASSVSAFRDFNDKYYYLKEQAKWFVLGLFGLIVTSSIDYRKYQKVAVSLIGISIILLLLVFIPGIGIKAYGAHRWINLGFINLQPAELTKLTLIIYLSAWFSTDKAKTISAKIIPFLSLSGLLVGLIMLEPDMGTTIVLISTSLVMYFLAGGPITHFLMIIPVGLLGAVGLIMKSPYRFKRLTTFLDPTSDPQGASYHIRQVLIALGSGGLWGIGIGKSMQKYEYLPEAMTDSIFAVIAEEIGFIGSLFLLFVFLYFLYNGYKIAKKAPDKFGQLLAAGITTWIGIQICINIGAMVAILPLTGVPLPFISYGGSSLIVILAGIGILLNISKQR